MSIQEPSTGGSRVLAGAVASDASVIDAAPSDAAPSDAAARRRAATLSAVPDDGSDPAAPADLVRAATLRLAERFRATSAAGLTATFEVRLTRHGDLTMTVADGRCAITAGPAAAPDATLATDVGTWLALVDGHTDGVSAFLDGSLAVSGDLALATRFETLFAPGPHNHRPRRSITTHTRGVTLDSLVVGSGPPVLLLHGLGASKVSFLPTVAALADRFEVHAIDLPGFGHSSKPLPVGRRYSFGWFADVINGYLIENRLGAAHIVGNSLGGRIGLELALRHPRSVRSLAGLGAAVGFDHYRRIAPLLRHTQLQWLGVAPVRIPASVIERVVRDLFHDPQVLPEANHLAAADDVRRSLTDPGYRLALLACARTLGAERSRGSRAYWSRLEGLRPPSLWIFGDHDRLVSSDYAQRIRTALPRAVVDVWEDVGHVPQFEAPERVGATLTAWLAETDAAA